MAGARECKPPARCSCLHQRLFQRQCSRCKVSKASDRILRNNTGGMIGERESVKFRGEEAEGVTGENRRRLVVEYKVIGSAELTSPAFSSFRICLGSQVEDKSFRTAHTGRDGAGHGRGLGRGCICPALGPRRGSFCPRVSCWTG